MWGSSGSGDGQFNFAHHLALTQSGDVYVGDLLNNRVQQFTPGGGYLRQWSVPGSDGIAQGPDGSIYVVDSDQIHKFSPTGVPLLLWGSSGSGPGEFDFPVDVAVDAEHNVYVTEAGNHRVQKFDSLGTYLGQWGTQGSGDGQFEFPFGVTAGPDGYVYVADVQTHRIQKFTKNGVFVLGWGTFGSNPGSIDSPGRPCVLADGRIVVPDQGNQRVQMFTNAGTFILSWGSAGTAAGEFNHPTCVACDALGTVYYVMDKDNSRVQKFVTPTTDVKASTWGAMKKLYR